MINKLTEALYLLVEQDRLEVLLIADVAEAQLALVVVAHAVHLSVIVSGQHETSAYSFNPEPNCTLLTFVVSISLGLIRLGAER